MLLSDKLMDATLTIPKRIHRHLQKMLHANGNNVNELNIHEPIVLFAVPTRTHTHIIYNMATGVCARVFICSVLKFAWQFIKYANIKVSATFGHGNCIDKMRVMRHEEHDGWDTGVFY